MRNGRASVFAVGERRVNGNGSDGDNEMDRKSSPKRDDIRDGVRYYFVIAHYLKICTQRKIKIH